MTRCFPDVKEKEEMRRIIGRFGLTGPQQVYNIVWKKCSPLNYACKKIMMKFAVPLWKNGKDQGVSLFSGSNLKSFHSAT